MKEQTKVNRFTLPNGLRVVHLENPYSGMVVLDTLFDVGSKDEDPNITGLAHLCEHLMFTGSKNVPDYDTVATEAGAENNAYTTSDLTNYYITIPAVNAETAFWMESDRMLSLNLDDKSIINQKGVVIEEFKQRVINQPYGDATALMYREMFTQSPYQWRTIGKEPCHIEEASLDAIKSFFRTYYQPSNAILSVVGNISLEETKRLCDKYYSSIPSLPKPKRNIPHEGEQQHEIRLTAKKDVPKDILYICFHSPRRLESDYYISDIISDILATGQSSRLVSRLVIDQKKFTSLDAAIDGSIEEGIFRITGIPAEGVSKEEAESLIWKELDAMTQELISEKELSKIVNKLESKKLIEDMEEIAKADNLAYYELIGQPELYETIFTHYQSITPEQIQQTARKIFRRSNMTLLWYLSEQ